MPNELFRLGVVALPMLAGCYTYTPMSTGVAPAAGEAVALDITDAGRVQLGERFGPGVMRVEGRLTSDSEQQYALNVHRVAFFAAPPTRWSGEAVRIERGFVGSVWRRELSRGRTALAVGAVVAGAVGVFITTDLAGFFSGSTDPEPPPPDPSSSRVGYGLTISWVFSR